MGRVKDELLKEESGSHRSPEQHQHGATWVPHETRNASPTMPVLTASVEAPARHMQPHTHQRTTSAFISAKRQQGAEPPAQVVPDHHAGRSPSDEGRGNSIDPYAHLRNQSERPHREPPVAPVPAYEAYEVVATPVIEKDDKDSNGNKNPLRDWRIWVFVLAVAALVGLSVGLVMSKNQSVAPAPSTSGLPDGAPEPTTLAPEPTTLEPVDNGEPEAPAPNSEDQPEEAPVPSPADTSLPDDDETTSLPVETEPSDPEPTEAPLGFEESRLAYCSEDGGPSVFLNPFSMTLVTASSSREEVSSNVSVLVDSVFNHLWGELSKLTNVEGYSIGVEFPSQPPQGLRRLQGATIKPLFKGCIDLSGETPVPTYEEVQAAISKSFSGSSLEIWLDLVNEDGIDIKTVTVYDESGKHFASAWT